MIIVVILDVHRWACTACASLLVAALLSCGAAIIDNLPAYAPGVVWVTAVYSLRNNRSVMAGVLRIVLSAAFGAHQCIATHAFEGLIPWVLRCTSGVFAVLLSVALGMAALHPLVLVIQLAISTLRTFFPNTAHKPFWSTVRAGLGPAAAGLVAVVTFKYGSLGWVNRGAPPEHCVYDVEIERLGALEGFQETWDAFLQVMPLDLASHRIPVFTP